MPIYEYQCQTCGKRTELLQKMSDPPLSACPECGGEVKKLISSPAVQFKGTGWYVTDYGGKKGGGSSSKSEGGGESKAAEKSSSSSSESSGSTSGSESKAAKASE